MIWNPEADVLGFVLGVALTVGVVGLMRKLSHDCNTVEAQIEYDQGVELAKLREELNFMSDRLGAVSNLAMMQPYGGPAPGMIAA